MLRTEEEAKKCWCPFARYTLEQDAVVSPAHCIASECMAWRADWVKERRDECEALHADMARPEGDGWEPVYGDNPHITQGRGRYIKHWRKPVGFCGLAGSP